MTRIQTKGTKPWTDDAKAQIRVLHDKGLSASQMMAYFPGRTRNAIMGQWKRLGLCEPTPRSILASPRARAAAPPKHPAITLPHASTFLPPKRNHAEETRSLEDLNGDLVWLPDTAPKPYRDLLEGECAWPMDVFEAGTELYCGCKTLPRMPYCAAHTGKSNKREARQPYKRRKPGRWSMR